MNQQNTFHTNIVGHFVRIIDDCEMCTRREDDVHMQYEMKIRNELSVDFQNEEIRQISVKRPKVRCANRE